MAKPHAINGLLLLLALVWPPGPATAAEPGIGQPAPAFDLPTLAGNRVALSDFKGQFVVLHFGAGW